jgi:hypothetical protein
VPSAELVGQWYAENADWSFDIVEWAEDDLAFPTRVEWRYRGGKIAWCYVGTAIFGFIWFEHVPGAAGVPAPNVNAVGEWQRITSTAWRRPHAPDPDRARIENLVDRLLARDWWTTP